MLIEDATIGIDYGSGDETAITIRIGDKMHCIPDPFASAIAERLALAERILTLQSQGAKMVMPEATEGMVLEYLKPEYGGGVREIFKAMHTAAPDLLAEGVGE